MTIVLTGDKNVLSLLPPEDARQVLLALFSKDGDLPEMTPLANMAYTSMIGNGIQIIGNKSATGKPRCTQGSNRNTAKQSINENTIRPEEQIKQLSFSDVIISSCVSGGQNDGNNGAELQELRFDGFWSAYPRKIGKEAARKAWRRIKPTADHQMKILAAIEKAKNSYQWKKDKGQYIPNPATWLNQARWDDEIQPDSAGRINSNSGRTADFHQREYVSEYLEQFVTNDFGVSMIVDDHANHNDCV
jgi:hypothetical protein